MEKGFYKSGFEYVLNFKNFVLIVVVCKKCNDYDNDKWRRLDVNCCENLIEGFYIVLVVKMV